MWTTENRPRYDRDRLRYPSDLTDEEWSLVELLISSGQAWRSQTRGGGAEVVNGVMYVLSTGCQWGTSPRICRHGARYTTT